MESNEIYELYSKLKNERSEYTSIWNDISEYVGLRYNSNDTMDKNQYVEKNLDRYINDPTAAISVMNSSEYLLGIVWGLGGDAFKIVPSESLLDNTTVEEVGNYFNYATEKVLDALNNSESGLHTALKPYFQDQFAFGTSGLGVFKNPKFNKGQSESPLIVRYYGVDSICIDEGINGMVDYIFTSYSWGVNRIVNEFAVNQKTGLIDDKMLATLPRVIVDAYKNNRLTDKFNVVQAIYPREDYNPKLRGKRGAKYKGDWFLDGDSDKHIFASEDYKVLPIAICRQIKVGREKYGRSSGTMLIGSIRLVNHAVGEVIQILEKMEDPALLLANNSLMGDSVLDSSSGSVTVFNESLLGNSKQPITKMYDVGDPTPIIQWLEPYLNNKITTAFKNDMLLDMNSDANMTATEASQRARIRAQALSGMLNQQYNEMVYPIARRTIQLLLDMDLLGVRSDSDLAKNMMLMGKSERIIPDVIADFIASGKQWFKIEPNDRVKKMMKTEKLESLMQFINVTSMLAQLNPDILMGINLYQSLKDMAVELGIDASILSGEREFKELLAQKQQQQQQLMNMQANQMQAQTSKDLATTGKAVSETNEIKQRS